MGYQFQFMPKLILGGSFHFQDEDLPYVSIVDDPDVLRKTASSQVVHEWGEITPKKNASLIHLIALGAHETTGPNRNGDAFRTNFLKQAHPTFKKHGALYRNHKSKDYSARDGDIEKTAFHDAMGRAELLVSANHDKCADWLSDLEKGKRVDFSMGFDCEYDECSKCGHLAPTRKDYCEHVKRGAAEPYGMGRILPDGTLCHVFNDKGVFNDISKVGVGADMIAQSLRKVAGLDEEIIGGADLMEQLFPDVSLEKYATKIALATKLSRMEKQVPALGILRDKETKAISEKLAAQLRGLSAQAMFGELAKLGCLLPARDLFSLVMGDRFYEIEPYVDEMEKVAHRAFSYVTSSDQLLRSVCANKSYECGKIAHEALATDDQQDLFLAFGMDIDLAEERLVKTAMSGSRFVDLLEPADVSEPARKLLEEYAAYKLAALEAGWFDLDSGIAQFAVMIR